MKQFTKMLDRADLNNMTNTEIDELLILVGIDKQVTIEDRAKKIDRILGWYRRQFDANDLYVKYDDGKPAKVVVKTKEGE